MSNDLNLCQFIGRASRDPETRYMTNGDPVTNMSIGVGWKTKDKDGTEWVRCVAYGKLAEIIGQYVKKGTQVHVAGRMTTRKWNDKDGVEKYTTEIVLDRMQLLGSAPDREQAPTKTRDKAEAWKAGAPKDLDDDPIPF
jgi:single-strand DNA-binding protein